MLHAGASAMKLEFSIMVLTMGILLAAGKSAQGVYIIKVSLFANA